jgi:hypothetical protein
LVAAAACVTNISVWAVNYKFFVFA